MFLDMFDKLDDIIFAPVNAICEWSKEPLRRFEHDRELQNMQREFDNTQTDKRLESELYEEKLKAENDARAESLRIDADARRWNAEIDQMISDQEQARNDRVVESLKNYQLDLSRATLEIVKNLGEMSLELRAKANDMIQEKTEAYRKMQKEAIAEYNNELKEVKEMFADDRETFEMMRNEIIDERRSIIDLAKSFILELSDDIKRVNQNIDELTRMGMNNTDKYLSPLASALGMSTLGTDYNARLTDGKDKVLIESK